MMWRDRKSIWALFPLDRCTPGLEQITSTAVFQILKNVAASDAENTDGENKICFIFQKNIKQMISYDTKLSKSGNRNIPDTLVRGVTHARFMFY